jgi:hypothetical protein
MEKEKDADTARIIACYVKMHRAAQAVLKASAPNADIITVSDSVHDYWKAIAANWTGSRDLIIIEQDIEIAEDTVSSFASCSEPWCTYWYHSVNFTQLRTALGCTRFRASLQSEVSIDTISTVPVSWDVIDSCITGALKERGYKPHVHGEVRHHQKWEFAYDFSGTRVWRHANCPYPSCFCRALRFPSPSVRVDSSDFFGVVDLDTLLTKHQVADSPYLVQANRVKHLSASARSSLKELSEFQVAIAAAVVSDDQCVTHAALDTHIQGLRNQANHDSSLRDWLKRHHSDNCARKGEFCLTARR